MALLVISSANTAFQLDSQVDWVACKHVDILFPFLFEDKAPGCYLY